MPLVSMKMEYISRDDDLRIVQLQIYTLLANIIDHGLGELRPIVKLHETVYFLD